MRISFACVLLLSATVLAQENDGYRKFINQHINGDMSADRCDQVIQNRGITVTDSNECRNTNTFIRATTNHIRAICQSAGEPYGRGLTKSLLPFNIVVCTLKNQGARRPRCQYRGQARTRKIAIACQGTFPTHFDGDIVYFQD
ncbi:ribonuclease-like 3 [Anoplopoma fimbria]|uniref:ribonuclease-like 3 n=1 Tax=Anoplopoma fimbria TaxID=229290 RepID=UPI0023EAEED2|nr:ribonuclease-like 3 [Anoplopoma fimbria]